MSEEKKQLRTACRKLRRAIPPDHATRAAKQVAERITSELTWPSDVVVAGYWPFPDELDPRPSMAALHGRGHPLCLPVVTDKVGALVFRAWAPGEALVEGVFDTRVPPPDRPVVEPTVLLVPLLAFDRAGYRLGYGGGYYDRTLAALAQNQPTSIGLAFAAQEVDTLPHEAHDRRLDWVITEQAAHRIS